MNYLKLTNNKLSVETITELVSAENCGAISVFMGTTRDHFEGKNVVRLEYEAYEGMALKVLEKTCEEIREKWPNVQNIAIYHRLGSVPVKEASIIIAISSPHRMDAIQAVDYCINNVKKNVTIWKKEIYDDAEPAKWKENSECAWSTPYPPKIKKFKLEFAQKVEAPLVPPHLVQIKTSNSVINERIANFMKRKREDINVTNIREFCKTNRDLEYSCARVDASLQKRHDSKSHLQVNTVLNAYSHRDQTNSNYLTKYIPKNGIEERLENVEFQLGLTNPTPRNIYKRLKNLEDKMLYLESISPEYINFWEKSTVTSKYKKKIFTVDEIDNLIGDLEKRRQEEKSA